MLSDNGFRMGASPYHQPACLLQVNPGLHKGSEVSGVLIRLPALVFRNPIIVFFSSFYETTCIWTHQLL